MDTILLSTGMSMLNEVKEAIKVLKKYGSDGITLYRCTTQ